MANLWGGRFEGATDTLVWEFNRSLPFDRRLWREDITGSIAHATMLARQNIITAQEADALLQGLDAIEAGLGDGTLALPEDAEDIHSAIEQLLRERIGAVAGKLHTARSRNDQVATDLRLYIKSAVPELLSHIKELQTQLVTLAEEHITLVLPGRTHHQHAQPVLLSHHLMAYFWMLERDKGRLRDALQRANVLPLGSGALAGTPFPIDRDFVREALGFATVSENSMDAVSDRDFAVEICAALSLVMMHLSRLSEEIILWNAPEFGFIELADAVTTGSSIMPQKKNPDVAELIRGKTGRVYGNSVALLTVMKGLALAYNKDMQEDKEPLFDSLDTAAVCVRLMTRLLTGIQFRESRMRAALYGDFSTATDLADALAKNGVPFREAHEVVGRLVRQCLADEIPLEELTIEILQRHDDRFTGSALSAILPEASANARSSVGGTGTQAVREQIVRAHELIQ